MKNSRSVSLSLVLDFEHERCGSSLLDSFIVSSVESKDLIVLLQLELWLKFRGNVMRLSQCVELELHMVVV